MCIDCNLMLDQLYYLKVLDENTSEDIQEVMGDCTLGEEFEVEGYERMEDAAPFANISYSESCDCTKYFFSSEEMTEYYRIVRKIGRLKGWKEKDNPYLIDACNADIKQFRMINNNGSVYGNLYTKTNHKYASSWVLYVYSDFYDYWDLFFAIRNIFGQYKKRLQRIKLKYNRLLSEPITEVAA